MMSRYQAPYQPQSAAAGTMPQPKPDPSVNIFADSIFTKGLGAAPHGLLPDDDSADTVEDILPQSQRNSPVMLAAHASVDEKVGRDLATLTLAELQALKTQIVLREKQLLTTSKDDELFAPIQPDLDPESTAVGATSTSTPSSHDPDASADQHADAPAPRKKLSLLEYARIRQETAHLGEVVCIRTTADLVKLLRQPHLTVEIPGRRKGTTPLNAAMSFVATTLRLTYSTVNKRITAAAAMWPAMQYRRTTTKTPHLARELERGRVPFDSATAAQDKLTLIRQAVRRAGGDAIAADDLVEHKEREFVHHALRNNPHTFSRFAKSRSDAVTNELIGPTKTLTAEQVKHEKGMFYDAPIGDNLHRLTLVVDDGELLHLTAIREFATKLCSLTSTLRAQAHADQPDVNEQSEPSAADGPADDRAKHPRLTPEDIELGIGQLFDGQTKAERWLNTLFDFTSAGLMLHKTYDPHATADEQRQRDTALQKAAEHSEILTDILGFDKPLDGSPAGSLGEQPEPPDCSSNSNDPLQAFVPPGYQLLRPNLDLIVEISLRDLLGPPPESSEATAKRPRHLTNGATADHGSDELTKLLQHLKADEQGLTVPVGSPGNVKIDYALVRQQACQQRIIPMILNSASQPLDVGRAQRSFSSAIRRALHVRDRGCIVPGCPRPASWCEPHHIQEWSKGGATSVANGVLLCRQHHSAVHKGLLHIHMETDGLASCSLPLYHDPLQRRYRNIFWRAA